MGDDIQNGASFNHGSLDDKTMGGMSRASVIDLAVYVAELHDRKQYDDDHEDDRLGCGRTYVQSFETGVVYLVDQDGCAGPGTALRHDVDDGEGVKESVNDVDD